MVRQLFPHDKLGDEYYWVVVESIDHDMAGSPALAGRIRDGLAELNQAAGGDFAAVDADKQADVMKNLERTPFFSDMFSKTQFYFYNNKAGMAEVRLRGLFLGEWRLHQPRLQRRHLDGWLDRKRELAMSCSGIPMRGSMTEGAGNSL